MFNSLNGFSFMYGNMDVLEMAKSVVSRAVVARMNLETVKIKGLQDLVWLIHDSQTHN